MGTVPAHEHIQRISTAPISFHNEFYILVLTLKILLFIVRRSLFAVWKIVILFSLMDPKGVKKYNKVIFYGWLMN